jgi:hypothetical protein
MMEGGKEGGEREKERKQKEGRTVRMKEAFEFSCDSQ